MTRAAGAARRRARGWRRIAAATWGHPTDPQFYGDLDIDATEMLRFIEEVRERTGVRLTVTHLVGKAVATALARHPQVNAVVGGGRVRPRQSIDVFFIVSADGGNELSGAKVRSADSKPVVEIARELAERNAGIQSGRDDELSATKVLFNRLPSGVMRRALRFSSFLNNDLGIDLRRFGIPDEPFGSVMVSSIGMWSVSRAYSPLAPYYRVPFIALVGSVEQRPAVVDGAVVPRPMLTCTATFDHRYLDGFQAARIAQAVKEYCVDPAAAELPPDGEPLVEDGITRTEHSERTAGPDAD